MKQTGIIMSGNHPKLILEGIKTQTRRVMKPQPKSEGGSCWVWNRVGPRSRRWATDVHSISCSR